MNHHHKLLALVTCLLCLCISAAAADQEFKVYIATDMEGCSGVTCSEQVAGEEGKVLMAGDMNACIEGCFAAGATEVVVRDHHSGGRNVDPELIDKRAKLIQGATPDARFKGIEGADAIILLGHHAKARTPKGTLAHSYSSASIQGMWLNGRSVGESVHETPRCRSTSGDGICKFCNTGSTTRTPLSSSRNFLRHPVIKHAIRPGEMGLKGD